MDILEEVYTEFGNIKILAESDGSCTYFQDECFHSQADADGVSTCAYVHIMYRLIRQVGARNVLMLGCAGGTLATMLRRLGCGVTVVDINPYAFTLAKRYFQMPQDVECVTADGAAFLKATRVRYDAIAIDVFDNSGTLPPAFTTAAFFRIVRKVLEPEGRMVMNVMTAHDLDLQADQIAGNMEAAQFSPVLFDWPGTRNRNTIIGAGGGSMRIQAGKSPRGVTPDLKGLVSRNPQKFMGKK